MLGWIKCVGEKTANPICARQAINHRLAACSDCACGHGVGYVGAHWPFFVAQAYLGPATRCKSYFLY